MKETRIEFISAGFKAILESEGTKALVQSAGEQIQQNANANAGLDGDEGFSFNVWRGNYGGGRWVGSVTTTGKASREAEAEDKALSRAVK